MKRLTALLLAAALALSLAACGPEGKAADTVRYGLSNAWDALMPYNSPSGSNYSRIIYDKIYDRLAYVHADGSLEPRAASSWESADGGTAALFHLDEHAAFHDGTPVTAEHWADTIALLTDPACPTLGRSAFAVLSGTDDTGAAVPGEALGAEAVDKYTLKLTFKTPTTPEDFLLDKNREYYVLPTHLLEGTAPEDVMELALWDEPVGSGPCKFVSETPGSQLVLEANPDYQLGAPGFDRLVITVIDKSNLLTSLIAGDLDYYAFGGNVSVEDAEVARAAGLEVLEGTVPNSFYELMLNNETIPSAAVRRAIDLALDKEALCLHTAQGLGEPAASDLTPGTGYDSGLTWARDVDGAKALLAEGGYDGRTYTMACTANRSGLAALMQQELAEAGGEGTRGEVVKQLEKILFDQYRDPHLAVKPKALEGRGGQYYSEAACELMNAIYNDKRILMHVNTRNNGAINGLPDDCAVEVSSLITASGPLPLNVAPFPEDTLRLLQLMKSFERLTIEAALTGNRHTAWRALMLNPLIVSGEKLELALDEVIAENRQWLPAFHA